jgi:hypothetical protein
MLPKATLMLIVIGSVNWLSRNWTTLFTTACAALLTPGAKVILMFILKSSYGLYQLVGRDGTP